MMSSISSVSLFPSPLDADAEHRSLQFPTPFVFNIRQPITLVELRMRFFSGKIRQKPQWWEKIRDIGIVAKWRSEMIEHDRAQVEELWGGEERYVLGDGRKQWPRDPITGAQLDYILDELTHVATHIDKATGIYPAVGSMVYESQQLIPPDVKSALLSGVAKLESVPEEQKDWHPETDRQVLDLVHPSLYHLCIGYTEVLDDAAEPIVGTHTLTSKEYMLRSLFDEGDLWALSEKHQWLPTDFEVSKDGRVRPLGYINNLHPLEHTSMYAMLSSILERFLPLFERVVMDALNPERSYAVQVNGYLWYEEREERDGDEEMYWPIIPDPSPFAPPSQDRRVSLSLVGRTLQIIVKLANILLTPENPKYSGGHWHVEGMANEHIVATGIYYYACENITESKLSFRLPVGNPDPVEMKEFHDQWDHQGCVTAWGIGERSQLNQVFGKVVATEDKCVAFPNTYQHCVEPFQLADPSKPGHRKILCFFLVDPLTRITSTSDVPPQQRSWWESESWDRLVLSAAPGLGALPRELYDEIKGYVIQGKMTRDEAEKHRESLMEERSDFVGYHDDEVFEVEWNMCEH